MGRWRRSGRRHVYANGGVTRGYALSHGGNPWYGVVGRTTRGYASRLGTRVEPRGDWPERGVWQRMPDLAGWNAS